MQNAIKKKKLYLVLLVPLGVAFSLTSARMPFFIEKYYSMGFYRVVSQALSSLTGLLPVSAAELVISTAAISVITLLIRSVIKGVSSQCKKWLPAAAYLLNLIAAASVVYMGFLLIWGFNYHRMPFADIAGLEVRPASVKELKALCLSLVTLANEARDKVAVDSRGVMTIAGGKGDALRRSQKGYDAAAAEYPALGGRYGRPKGVMLSYLMSYTGITGVYFPFTGEANVNTAVPDCTLPSTACHEMAHQRGFAREDEANYIAYLTCSVHPDPDFRYSGLLLALINSTNTLYKYDRKGFNELQSMYSPGLRRDLADISDFWRKFEGPVERISSDINDAYLKANLQKDGVYSYGRMVDLLIAQYRKKGLLPS